MKRYRVLVTVMLAAMALIAGCTSSSDTVDETTTAPPATTVAPPETVTTQASTTSTTLSPAAAIATVEALHEAISASNPDTALSLFADFASWAGATPGSPEWEKRFVEFEAWGRQSTLSDCEATDGTLTCLDTWERTNLSGGAGVIRVSEWEFRFDEEGLIANAFHEDVSGRHDDYAFEAALGMWMATAHPESYETFYLSRQTAGCQDQGVCLRVENWNTVEGVAELSPLIDEFVAQSDEYPLSEGAAATTTTTTGATTTVAKPVATELRLTFHGEGCTYEGPTELRPGPVRLLYVNESDELSQMFFSRLDEGYTAQDVIDQLGPQPSSQEAPSWVKAMIPREGSAPGRTLSWRLDLEPGVYTMVCARLRPAEGHEGWFGAGLTVEE